MVTDAEKLGGRAKMNWSVDRKDIRSTEMLDYFFQRPCRLQYARAVTPSAFTGKNADGFEDG